MAAAPLGIVGGAPIAPAPLDGVGFSPSATRRVCHDAISDGKRGVAYSVAVFGESRSRLTARTSAHAKSSVRRASTTVTGMTYQ